MAGNEDTGWRLLARLFVPANDAAGAADWQPALVAALRGFSPQPLGLPAPWPAFPDLFELTFALAPATAAGFEAVLALAPGGWTVTRDLDCSAVWNPAPGVVFLCPGLRWAEILLVPPADLATDDAAEEAG